MECWRSLAAAVTDSGVTHRADPIPALKRQLGAELARALDGWRAADICDRIGTDPPRISDLRRGRLARFSLETLIRYMTRLRRRVDLIVTVERATRV
jgi:predicted XRE-type DNA-binding protein